MKISDYAILHLDEERFLEEFRLLYPEFSDKILLGARDEAMRCAEDKHGEGFSISKQTIGGMSLFSLNFRVGTKKWISYVSPRRIS